MTSSTELKPQYLTVIHLAGSDYKHTHLHTPVAGRAIRFGSQHTAVGNSLVNSKQAKISFDEKRDSNGIQMNPICPTLSLTMVHLVFSIRHHSVQLNEIDKQKQYVESSYDDKNLR
jgi:hypothetical protein